MIGSHADIQQDFFNFYNNYGYFPGLRIDLETYNEGGEFDLPKAGVHKYVEAPDTEILIFSSSVDFNGTNVVYPRILLCLEALPPGLVWAILNPNVPKYAFNAPFERIVLSRHLGFNVWAGQYIDPYNWHCSRVAAARCGYPLNLKSAGLAIGIKHLKMESGTPLINYFSKPCKPTKANGHRTRNYPHHNWPSFIEFADYCDGDVLAESEVADATAYLPWNQMEKDLWLLDQQINDRGVGVNLTLVYNAIRIHARYVDRIYKEAARITGLDNPNSRDQLIAWLLDNEVEVEDLKKATVTRLLEEISQGDIRHVLEIRQELAKTSVKKYNSMRFVCGRGWRARGLFQFYGANRTGRWAGRMVQMQNLTKHYVKDIETARNMVLAGDGEALENLYGNVPDILSQLIRTAFEAQQGRILTVVDFSAIEARIIAWLAGEQWRIDVFAGDGAIYEHSAAKMFKVPVETVFGEKKDKDGKIIRYAGENYDMRAKGKVAELALGYQGWTGALLAMGAKAMGLAEWELPEICRLWREESPAIVSLWALFENVAKMAIRNPGKVFNVTKGVQMFSRWDEVTQVYNFYMQLPSGRCLVYDNVKLESSDRGVSIRYDGLNQKTKKYGRLDTYGGKLVENIVQAIARDCLGVAMLRVNAAGFPIVGHVHDEIIIEFWRGVLKEVEALMSEPISWAPGLVLKAEGFENVYYKK